jgi:NADH-quinone oxidoreductase subunit E
LEKIKGKNQFQHKRRKINTSGRKEYGIDKTGKMEIIHSMGADKEHVLAILIDLQYRSDESYIDEETAKLVAAETGISLKHIYDILTFYSMLRTKPGGKYVIEVCNSSPCYYSKSTEVAEFLERELQIKMGETTPDKMFSLHYTSCVGMCEIGPVIKIKDKIFGNLTQDKIRGIIQDLKGGKLDV